MIKENLKKTLTSLNSKTIKIKRTCVLFVFLLKYSYYICNYATTKLMSENGILVTS